ncbi:hypothetical protein FA15DRAFT_627880 [Coprinopsis marcescibilis]|uniref:Uncharacterized protein n=1 Tax=Coprinopsis marcescibilis TaxID=230819 RepID=A0A5C3KEA2_COPMA|nr:hypothetical protein FA15DRAFT_627880 [Coprinopsis marcescibilis]
MDTVNSPPRRRVLKRSASTASLPTPPRTYRRRARGRSRGSCDSDSDTEDGTTRPTQLSSDDEVDDKPGRKRPRVSLVQEKDDEEAFWMAGSEALPSKTGEASTTTSAKKPQAPLLYRKLQASGSTSHAEKALISPPASHRKHTNEVLVPSSPSPATTASAPVTPQLKSSKKGNLSDTGPVGPLRDSPSNPFVVTPLGAEDGVESLAGQNETETEDTVYDKPTVTYVFRGVKRVYQNPMFDHLKNRPLSPPPNSKLPVDDPLFSPDPTCKPRLLFPEAHKKRKARKQPMPRAQAKDSDAESDNEDAFGSIKAPVFGKGKKNNRLTLDAELRKAAASASDDDVFC